MTTYLRFEHLLDLAELIPGDPQPSDFGKIDAAVARYTANHMGRDVYASLPLKAAALSWTLIRLVALDDVHQTRAFAYLAAWHFLSINGINLRADYDAAVPWLAAVESGELDTRGLARYLDAASTA
jgi:prophage maintenance system killer protein